MTAEIATAVVDTIDVRVILVGAPDLETRWAEPFIAEKAYVYTDRRDCSTWVAVVGRAILKNGEIGKSERRVGFELLHTRGMDPAPSWLVEALKAAGVTW